MKSSLALLLSCLLLQLLLQQVAVQAQVPAALSVTNREILRTRTCTSIRTTSGSQNCGPGRQVVNGWGAQMEFYWFRAGNTLTTDQIAVQAVPTPFSGGTYTAPTDGVYYLSAFARCERQACDCTVRVAGTVEAAFGTDLNERWENSVGQSGGPIGSYWSNHGVEFVRRLTQNQQVILTMESGQGNDCLYETSYFYGHFNACLYFTDNPAR